MKTASACLLLAASSALAVPLITRDENTMIVGDMVARVSAASRDTSFRFTLSDRTAGVTTSTHCTLYLNPNGGPEREDVCESDDYLVRYVGDSHSIKSFTLEVERTAEPSWKARGHWETGSEAGDLQCSSNPPVSICETSSGIKLDPVIELDDPPTTMSTVSARDESTEPNPSLSLLDLVARASSASRSSRIEFKLFDGADYPDRPAHFCELNWAAMGGPREDACDNDAYLVRFVDGTPNINNFTLEVERVKEPKAKGRAHFETGTPVRGYECISQPAVTTCVINFGKFLEPVE